MSYVLLNIIFSNFYFLGYNEPSCITGISASNAKYHQSIVTESGLGICGRELFSKPAVSQVVLPGAAHGLDAAPVVAVVSPPHELCVVSGGALPLFEGLTGRNPAARPAAVGSRDLVSAPLVPLAQLLGGGRNRILSSPAWILTYGLSQTQLPSLPS